MHDSRSEEPLKGAALDREIEQLMAIDPSPEYVARIRTRLAAQPQRVWRGWRFQWALVTTAGVVVTAGVAVLLISGPRADPPPLARTATDVHLAASSRADLAPLEPLPPSARGAATLRTTAADQASRRDQTKRESVASQATPIELPEVIVSVAEVRAFRRLVAVSAGGHVEVVPQVAEQTTASSSTVDMEEIMIAPIEIAPIALIARLEGEAK
jgi:hypothetical protein